MKQRAEVPSDINSSLTIFYVVFVPIWAYIFSGYFPDVLRSTALLLCVLFPLALYVFQYSLFQLIDGVNVLRAILFYACLIAVADVASAFIGPLADGSIPSINVQLFGAQLYTYSGPVYLTPSVFIFYGFVTLVTALLCAGVCELLYSSTYRFLPRKLRSLLKRTDTAVDNTAYSTVQSMFYTTEFRGLVAATGGVIIYVAAYLALILLSH